MRHLPDGTELAEIDFGYRPSRLVCPCGVRRPEALYQSDREGKPTGVFDRTACILTCAACGRVITIEGVVIARKEVETA